jgi:hypothetical protein
MKKIFKNPLAWAVAAFVIGGLLLAIGHDKDESTITNRTKGSVVIMLTGGALIVGGLIGMFKAGSRKKNQ